MTPKQYEQTVVELKKTFSPVQDKSDLCRELFCCMKDVFQKLSRFFLNKLEPKNKLVYVSRTYRHCFTSFSGINTRLYCYESTENFCRTVLFIVEV